MSWDAYRAENPMLTEMREYNTRVRDRVLLKKGRTPTVPPQDEVQDRTDGPEAFAGARLDKTKGKTKIEFTDRYAALGMDLPDPKTMCKGPCEGTGVVPIKGEGWEQKKRGMGGLVSLGGPSSVDPRYQKLWDEAEAKQETDDGWHFVKCLDCKGTGKRTTEESWVEDLRNLVG